MDSTNRLTLLRQRAEKALAEQNSAIQETPEEIHQHFQKIFEELRIYQAELEIQNAELTEALHNNEHLRDQYAALFQKNPAATLVIDEQGIIIDANPAAITLFQFGSVNHLRYHSIFRLLDPESGFALKQTIRNFLRNVLEDRTLRQLRTLSTPDLQEPPRVLDCTLSRLPQSYAQGQNVLLLFDNLTASYSREHDLLLYENLLNHSRSHQAVFSVEGHCLIANRTMLDFFGKKREEVVGFRRENWMNAKDADQQTELDRLVVHSSSAVVREYPLLDAQDKKRLLLGYRFPVFHGYNKLVGVGLIASELSDSQTTEHHIIPEDGQQTI